MQTVDGYRILRELGLGGAGVVYLAQRPDEVPVALKLLLQLNGGRAQLRFEREVEALTKLRHPSVVSLRGAGTWQGRPYLVMDYVEGASLHERLRERGPMPPKHAMRLVRDLARAVQHAHDRGLLHRDLKPANVLLDLEGRGYLSDFGLTRDVDPARSRLTRTGGFVGTPGYWSPEQALGEREATSVTTDVFGLGGILYSSLTARSPRPSELSIQTLEQPILPPAELRPEVPRWLSDVCMRCLEDDPAKRYPTANAVALALRAPPRKPRSAAPQALWVSLGSLAISLLLAVIVFATRGLEGEGGRSRDPVPVAPPQAESPMSQVRALLDSGATAEALALAEQLLANDTTDAEVWVFSGTQKSQANRFAEAAVDLERAVKLDPAAAGAWLTLSHVLRKLGRLDEAVAATDRAGQLDPLSSDAPYNRGTILLEAGRFAEAADAFAQATRLNPQDAGAHANRGAALVRLQRHAEALESFQACLDFDPNALAAIEGRGAMLLRLGHPKQALRDLQRALETDPEAPTTTWVNHGIALTQLKRKAEARTSFEEAIRRGDSNPQTLVNLGLVCRDLEDLTAARRAFEAARSLLPPGPGRKKVEAYLEQLPLE